MTGTTCATARIQTSAPSGSGISTAEKATASACIGLGRWSDGRRQADGLQFGPRLRHRHAIGEPAVYPHARPQPVRIVGGPDPQWQPQLLDARHRKAFRHHADDCGRHAGNAERGAHDVVGSAEAPAPEAIADDSHVGCTGDFVRRQQRASHDRLHTRQREYRRRHQSSGFPVGPAVAGHDVDLLLGHGAKPRKRLDPLPQDLVVGNAELGPAVLVDTDDADDPLALVEWG